ncbi:MAG: hypothetical protein B1H03_02330 [Planctomycetales bacterium 4484_113]|nr:MAG: hypothetical protein B1H03_02330 [Planctomycetales bacterium 4484_113]
MERILLLGATGFIGGAIREELRQRTPEMAVRALVRPQAKPRALEPPTEVVAGDIRNRSDVELATRGCEAIINAVGIIAEKGRNTFEAVHIEAMRHTLAAAKKAGVRRYILISALGTRTDASSRYHRTKFRGEELLRGSGLNFTILRPSVVFGSRDRFINLLACLVRRGPVIPVVGAGRNRFQPVFVEELATIVRMSLFQGIAEGETMPVGGGKAYTYNEIIAVLKRTLRRESKPLLHLPMGFMGFFARSIGQPVNYDQWLMLQEDSVLTPDELARLERLFGFRPSSLEEVLPRYLSG